MSSCQSQMGNLGLGIGDYRLGGARAKRRMGTGDWGLEIDFIMIRQPTLETQRLILRPFIGDRADIVDMDALKSVSSDSANTEDLTNDSEELKIESQY